VPSITSKSPMIVLNRMGSAMVRLKALNMCPNFFNKKKVALEKSITFYFDFANKQTQSLSP